MEKKTLKKILVIAIVFMLTFSNYGFTLQALATSEGISVLGMNLFGKQELDFDAYFLDENGDKQKSNVADVNSEMTLVVELDPKEEGFLKQGTIKAIAEEGEANFEITEVLTVEEEEEQDTLTQVVAPDATLLKTEQVVDTESNAVETENVVEDETETTEENIVQEQNTVDDETIDTTTENEVDTENTVSNDAAIENETNVENNVENTVAENETVDNTITETTTPEVPTEEVEQEELVDEDAVANEEIEAETAEEEKVVNSATATSQIVGTNEISVEDVIDLTKLYIKIKFNKGENLNVIDLYKEIKLQFLGTYINVDLEEVVITAEKDIEVGWSYTKDFTVTSEYTKVSPFEVVDTKGTLVENKIVVNRDITDENYLPIKQTKIEIEVPELNGKKPVAMEVSANKLKATKGEDINEVVFTQDNWEYIEENNTLTITVENTDGVYTYGEDVYIVTYRYEDYVEENEIDLHISGKVTVEEYSSKENNVISKELNKDQKIIVNVGELITYSIGTTEEKINKGKINANYNSEETIYETEFTSTVNINVLTNDVLNEFTLKDTKEYYIDNQNLEFETQDVKYKKIKFKYEEISTLLANGGTIEIKSNNGELLYTLNSELVKSQENCEIEIKGEVTGVEISVKNISVNGTITVDFVKSIGKCSFDKSAFNNFVKIESRVKAEVKYLSAESATELATIKTSKEFENSFTNAEIEIDKESLSTIEDNENVEIKIELNNHLETSDLYVNPVFEVVFPKYVTNVEVKSTNLIYEDELKVKSAMIFNDEGVIKMQIALAGVQKRFSEGTLTKGTNIIINTKIEVDNYTPRKNDQVRMYYYNEGVTNYQSQTKWTVNLGIPTGILKTTNGFDVDVVNFAAPSGFITINEIENYDGLNSEVASIKQGEETREIAMENGAVIATMNLIAMNNTENECTDVIFLGRIPTRDATDVKTGENLGNNIETRIITGIEPDDYNPISSKIYYSPNAKATKNLNDGNNAWTQTPSDMSLMKSFLIVPTGIVSEGAVFKYTYQFLIPENLPYETKMYGSFGAFYNNHSDIAVVYETTVADKVGLMTKAGPKLEAIMSVNIGDGADILEQRMMTYTITVKNTGSVDLTDVKIQNKVPKWAKHCSTAYSVDSSDNGLDVDNIRTLEWNISNIAVGHIIEKSYTVRADELPNTLKEYAELLNATETDENGYYGFNENNEKFYVTQLPSELYIENKATISVGNLGREVTTNTVKNKLIDANFEIKTALYAMNENLAAGDNLEYVVHVKNISKETLTNVVLEDVLPKELSFVSLRENTPYACEYDAATNKLKINIGDLESGKMVKLYVGCVIDKMKNTGSAQLKNQFAATADGDIRETGVVITAYVRGANLVVTQDASMELIKEYETFNIVVNVQNNGQGDSETVKYKVIIPEEIEILDATAEGNKEIVINTVGNVVAAETMQVDAGKHSALVIKARPKLLADSEATKNITIQSEVREDFIGALEVKPLELTIVQNPENPKTDEEKAQEEADRTVIDAEADDSYLETSQNASQNNNNTSQNNNNNLNNNNSNNNNNTDNDSNNNSNNDNSNNEANANTDTSENVNTGNIKIYGQVWSDSNKDGKKDEDEKYISKVNVQLQKNGTTVKAITTDSTGTYRFEDLPAGKYSVIYEYDSEKYVATTYKKQDVAEEVNSDAIELLEGKAVTNHYQITTGELKLDLGLQDRNNFDLVTHKYISKAIITTKGKENTHTYEDLDLAKLEIKSKELKNTKITFEYKIVIENIGNVAGTADTIVDYLPKDLKFNSESNTGWILNEDGTVYNNSLKDIEIKAGEKKELKLVLDKQMTEDNTGVIANKVGISNASSKSGLEENNTNNESTQEIIVSVSTGKTVTILFTTVLVIIAFAAGYMAKTGKIHLNKNFKRVYK